MSNNCCIQCPYCGKDVDVIQGMEMLAGNEWTALIQGLPNSMIGVLLRYLELFKPIKQDLRWSRRLSLTQEIIPMIKAAQVKRNGIVYAAPLPVWEGEMLKLVARPDWMTVPLKGNGLLIKVLADKGEQQAAQTEEQMEAQRRNRGQHGETKGFKPVAELLPNPSDKELSFAELNALAQQKAQEREARQKASKPPEGWRDNLPKTTFK